MEEFEGKIENFEKETRRKVEEKYNTAREKEKKELMDRVAICLCRKEHSIILQ